jgi:hypothetical protein
MARSFFNSKLWQGILDRIGVLETYQGTIPPAEDYNTVADIRAETSHSDGDRIFCLANQIIYTFDDASLAADDGSLVLKPNNIDSGDPGRWVFEQQLALKDHTHDDKADRITTPLQTRFLISDADGDPAESLYHSGSFSAADHNHDDDYATADDLDAIEAYIDAIETALAAKMDKYEVTEEDIGKLAVFNAEGNIIPTSSGVIRFATFTTGALTANVTKTVTHGEDMAIGYLIQVRESDDSNNTGVAVLKPNAIDPDNAIDIQVGIDISAPGLIIQIIGS